MKEYIEIPKVKVERAKVWAGWTLAGAAWMICFALVAGSAMVAAGGVLAWLLIGSETMLAAGLIGGLVLGLTGVWQVLRRLDRASKVLCRQSEA